MICSWVNTLRRTCSLICWYVLRNSLINLWASWLIERLRSEIWRVNLSCLIYLSLVSYRLLWYVWSRVACRILLCYILLIRWWDILNSWIGSIWYWNSCLALRLINRTTIARWISWCLLLLSPICTYVVACRIRTSLNLRLVLCWVKCVVSLILNTLTWLILSCVSKTCIGNIGNSSIDRCCLILSTWLILSTITCCITRVCSILICLSCIARTLTICLICVVGCITSNLRWICLVSIIYDLSCATQSLIISDRSKAINIWVIISPKCN